MKRLALLAILTLATLTACTPDFDPLLDSEQRSPTFRFETSHLLDDLLSIYPSHSALGGEELEEGQRIRLTMYCYDTCGLLIDKASTFALQDEKPSITLRHLTKDTPYRFVVVGDIVEYENDIDFFEHWFQMNYRQLSKFYVKIVDWNYNDAKENALWLYDTVMTVINQAYYIPIEQITYNGFVCFTNTESIEKLELTVIRHFSLNISPFSAKAYDNRTVTLSAPVTNGIAVGYTLPVTDTDINLEVKLTTSEGTQTVSASVHNPDLRPFRISFNCLTNTIEQYDFY